MAQQIDVYDFIINALAEIEKHIDDKLNKLEKYVKEQEDEAQQILNLRYLFRDITQMEAQ